MNDKIIKKIAELLGEKMEKTQKSQREVAKEMGISHSYVSDFLKGNTDKMSHATIKKFAGYVGYTRNEWQILETSNFKTVERTLKNVKNKHCMMGIPAYTGAGKTKALEIVSNRTPNCFYVLAKSTHQKKNFLKDVQQAMGISQGGSLHDRVMSICDKLNSLEHPVLIIDDYGKLPDSVMLLTQIFYDETEDQAGILLAGTEYFYKYIRDMAEKDKRGFRELQRRIQYFQTLARPSKSEIVGICKMYDITNDHALAYMSRNAPDFGTLRNLIENGLEAADGDGSKVTAALLDDLQIGIDEGLRA